MSSKEDLILKVIFRTKSTGKKIIEFTRLMGKIQEGTFLRLTGKIQEDPNPGKEGGIYETIRSCGGGDEVDREAQELKNKLNQQIQSH